MDNIAMPDMLPPVVLDATAVPDGDRDPLSAVGIGQLPPEIRFMIWELATDVGPGQVLEIREVECGGTYGEGETPYSIHRFVGKRIPPITALICSESRAIGCPSGMFVSFENPPHGSDEGSFTPNEDSAQRIQDVDRRWAWFDASRDMSKHLDQIAYPLNMRLTPSSSIFQLPVFKVSHEQVWADYERRPACCLTLLLPRHSSSNSQPYIFSAASENHRSRRWPGLHSPQQGQHGWAYSRWGAYCDAES
ncbi:hypothetical protein F5Y16DRAFT_315981 [Xylariaceae sp. FL0255]|nr:hypothetical protein F5Y16DRAFT_315981 [Xylariaceae sp. FL0255]